MEQSSSIESLAKALVAFQADMENVAKDATNPFFKSKFASLENIIGAAKPHLKNHGLAFAQFPSIEGLTTILMHESGEFISSDTKIIIKDQTPQGQGSAITYMRRYALSAALGIATEEDDDGNAATMPRNATQRPATAASKQQKPTKDASAELLAAKDRTKALLKMLGHDKLATKKDYEDVVFDLTDYVLKDEDIDAINEKLATLVEQKDANK